MIDRLMDHGSVDRYKIKEGSDMKAVKSAKKSIS